MCIQHTKVNVKSWLNCVCLCVCTYNRVIKRLHNYTPAFYFLSDTVIQFQNKN